MKLDDWSVAQNARSELVRFEPALQRRNTRLVVGVDLGYVNDLRIRVKSVNKTPREMRIALHDFVDVAGSSSIPPRMNRYWTFGSGPCATLSPDVGHRGRRFTKSVCSMRFVKSNNIIQYTILNISIEVLRTVRPIKKDHKC